jgi:hypothetical protein
MNAARILYRTRQLWLSILVEPAPDELEIAYRYLNPKQREIFEKMQPGEQAHSLQVLRMLIAQGEEHPDLYKAALLHDVGKSRFPLKWWERVLIVLVKAVRPECVQRWGGEETGLASFWRRAFVVAEHHPAWGAEIAAQAGVSPLGVSLIRKHQQDPVELAGDTLEDRLLLKLQAADDHN